MAIVPEHNKEYDNYSIKPKHLGVNDSFTFKLGFDDPVTGESKFGTWYKFTGELLDPTQQDNVSFFASPKLAEELMKFGTNDVVKVTKKEKDRANGGTFTTYEVEALSNAGPSEQQSEQSEVDQLVAMLVKSSNGQMQSPKWIKEQLGDTVDEAIVTEVVQKYASQW